MNYYAVPAHSYPQPHFLSVCPSMGETDSEWECRSNVVLSRTMNAGKRDKWCKLNAVKCELRTEELRSGSEEWDVCEM